MILKEHRRQQTPSPLNDVSTTAFRQLTQKYSIRCVSSNVPKEWLDSHENRFLAILAKYPNGDFQAEILTGLQAAIQV